MRFDGASSHRTNLKAGLICNFATRPTQISDTSGAQDVLVYQNASISDLSYMRSGDSLVFYTASDAANGSLSDYAMLNDWFTNTDFVEYLQDGDGQIIALSSLHA